MRLKLKLFIFRLLTILLFCQNTIFSLAQDALIKEVTLPNEIKTINALISNSQDLLWIATGQGLFCYKNNEFVRYYNEKQAELYCINVIEFDETGNKWYGTYNGMLVKYGEQGILKTIDIKPFCKTDNYLITSISIDKENKNKNHDILLTTSGGEIFSYDTSTNIVKKIKSPSDGTIYAIQYGYSPTIWLCTSDGFYTMRRNWNWKKKSDLYTAYDLYENEGKFWAIGRDENKKAALMLYYNEKVDGEKSKYIWKKFDLQQMSNIYTRFYKLGFTSGEMVWLATENGLIKYNPLNAAVREFKNYGDAEISAIQYITVQNNNLIWISTSGKKLFRVDLNQI